MAEVKAALELITGVSSDEQQLAHGSIAPLPSGSTLDSLGVSSGDSVELSLTPPPATPHLVVQLPESLATTFGPSVTIAAGPDDTIGDVMERIEAHVGVPEAAQILKMGDTTVSADADATLATLGHAGLRRATLGEAKLCDAVLG